MKCTYNSNKHCMDPLHQILFWEFYNTKDLLYYVQWLLPLSYMCNLLNKSLLTFHGTNFGSRTSPIWAIRSLTKLFMEKTMSLNKTSVLDLTTLSYWYLYDQSLVSQVWLGFEQIASWTAFQHKLSSRTERCTSSTIGFTWKAFKMWREVRIGLPSLNAKHRLSHYVCMCTHMHVFVSCVWNTLLGHWINHMSPLAYSHL